MTKDADKKISKLAQKLKKCEKVELNEPLVQDGKEFNEVFVRLLTLKERAAMETDTERAFSILNGELTPKVQVQINTLAFAVYGEVNGTRVNFDKDVLEEMNTIDFDALWSVFLNLTAQFAQKLPNTLDK